MEGSLVPSRRHVFLLTSPEQRRAQEVPVGWWRGEHGRVGWEEALGNRERNVAFPGQMDLPHSVQAWATELQVTNAAAGQGERHPLRAAKSPAIRARGTLGSLGRGSAAGNSSPEGRGSTLLYGRVVNQLHFLFPLLNIIMLSLPGFYVCLIP